MYKKIERIYKIEYNLKINNYTTKVRKRYKIKTKGDKHVFIYKRYNRSKTQNYIILETGGIGYKIFMSQTAIEKLEELGTKKKIYTYMRVREDDVSIYGFITEEELRMFELLLGVSGIGAKGAVSILSNITPSSFALAVITDEWLKIKSLPGIGVKTAQRIILELKDKLKTTSAISEKTEESNNLEKIVEEDSKFTEATAALQVLGIQEKK